MFSYTDLDVELKDFFQIVQEHGCTIPRLMCIQTDTGHAIPYYRHPLSFTKVTEWTPIVFQIKTQMEEQYHQTFNHCLIQKYRNGLDFIGRHSDKTIDIVLNSSIVTFSLGATRCLELRHKVTRQQQFVALKDNTSFELTWDMNKEYTHAVKKQIGLDAPRISLTFRHIGTFKTATGELIGKGAGFTAKEVLDSFYVDNH